MMKRNVTALLSMVMAACSLVVGAPLPDGTLGRLASEEFRERESGQMELLAWARMDPASGMDVLYGLSRGHENPEVRRRCLTVLRELVMDEYLREGPGYIGIRMMEEIVMVPGDDGQRVGIRVIESVAGSPAEKAGLVLGDLIVGMDNTVWRNQGLVFDFQEEIKKLKAGTRVVFKLLRNGQVVELPLVLGRRPPGALERFGFMSTEELLEADREARDRYFREWMDRRRAGD